MRCAHGVDSGEKQEAEADEEEPTIAVMGDYFCGTANNRAGAAGEGG